MSEVIRVKGLKEFQKALRQMDTSLGPELRKGFNEVANVVVDSAKTLVPTRTGNARDSMKPGSTQRAAQIKVGGNKAPYYPWLDFGGSVGRGHVSGQADSGATKRRFIPEGRFIYPTLRRKGREVTQKLEEVLDRLTKQAGF